MLFKRQGSFCIHPLIMSLLLLCISSMFFFNNVDRGTFFSYFVWIMVMNIGLGYKFNTKEILFLMRGFIYGSLIMAILVIVQQHHYYYPGSYRFSIQILNNTEVDPNYLASFMYFGIIFSIYSLLKEKEKKRKLLVLASFVIILIAIIMTGSRATYVALAVAFFGILTRCLKTVRKNIGPLLLLLLVCLLVIIIASKKISTEVIARFDLSMLMDESNMNRLQHWKAAVIALLKNPLLGYGASHTMTILSTYTGHVSDAHNTFLTILLHFGLIGAIPIFSLIFRIFTKLKRKKSKEWIYFYLGFLLINFIIANHLGISFWLPILIFYQICNREEF